MFHDHHCAYARWWFLYRLLPGFAMHHRPIQSDDASLLAHIYADPRAMRWLSADGLPLSDAAIQQIVATNVTRWQTLGFGTWLFFDDADVFVGYAGLKPTAIGGAGSIELLYGVVPDFWRQGLATKMVTTVLQHADTILTLPRLVGYTLMTNIASQQVLVRHGFVYQGEVTHADLPHYWYVRV
jgi:ribosomal-protein-alanine N-acetyltransferase